ncbi:MAG: SIMPL domain-containing protein [Pseudomonadota bacterium]
MNRLFVACAAALALSSCTQDTILQAKSEPRTITVVGEASVHAVPDIAVLNFSVRAQAVTSAEAFSNASATMNQVVTALKAMEVADRDLQTNRLALNPIYARDERGRYDRDEIVGYEAFQALTVRVRSIENAGAVIDAAVQAGANGLDGFSMAIDDPKALRDEARVAAVVDAKAKARAMAEAAGAELGEVMTLSVYDDGGRPQPILARTAAVEADFAGPSVQAGEQQVSLTVNATFRLK